MDALGEQRRVVAGHDWGAPVAWHTALLAAGPDPRGDRAQRALPAARLRPPIAGPAGGPRRRLLHGLLPGARRRRGRAGARPAGHLPPGAAAARRYRRAGARPRRPADRAAGRRVPGHLPGAGRPAVLAYRRRHRRVRGPVRAPQLQRAAELVPQPGPQLGADRGLASRAGAGAGALPGRRADLVVSVPGAREGIDAAQPASCPSCASRCCCRAAATGPSRSGRRKSARP